MSDKPANANEVRVQKRHYLNSCWPSLASDRPPRSAWGREATRCVQLASVYEETIRQSLQFGSRYRGGI